MKNIHIIMGARQKAQCAVPRADAAKTAYCGVAFQRREACRCLLPAAYCLLPDSADNHFIQVVNLQMRIYVDKFVENVDNPCEITGFERL